MKKFMDKDFLLKTETAKKLYAACENEPIFDWHCHLSPKEIYENNAPSDLAYLWLAGDHYKWRAMRSNGIDESYMTGDKGDFEKFEAFAKTLKYAVGNPLYHWTHLELQRFFGITDILNEKTAKAIYDKANEQIRGEGFSAQALIEKSNVKVICTTDDPADSLEYHIRIKEEGKLSAKVYPTFRPDKIVEIGLETFLPYIKLLCDNFGIEIKSIEDVLSIMRKRIDFFNEVGCRLSDHALGGVPFEECDGAEADRILKDKLEGKELSEKDIDKYKTFMYTFFAEEYHKRGWTMQLHIGALRNNNERMYNKLGPDTGFDSINDLAIAAPLSKLLNSFEKNDNLPKTILYTLNPKDNYVLGTMLGNFQSSDAPSKIQFGSGWWFNDQRDGMVEQMKALANLGLLGRFVGMLTDSRSFMSYPRHEYFRRIMCNLIGGWVENGEYPADMDALKDIIEGISYKNAETYFGFDM